jgi:hypothetical protein
MLTQKDALAICDMSSAGMTQHFTTAIEDAKRLSAINNAWTLAELEALEAKVTYLEKAKLTLEKTMEAFKDGFALFSQGGNLMPKKWYDVFAILRIYRAGALLYRLIVDIANIWKS